METSGYSNMRAGLDSIKMSGHGRAQAERHMRRAAAIVETLFGVKRGKADANKGGHAAA